MIISYCFFNRINNFDGKIPFDFKNCCSIKDNKNLGKLKFFKCSFSLNQTTLVECIARNDEFHLSVKYHVFNIIVIVVVSSLTYSLWRLIGCILICLCDSAMLLVSFTCASQYLAV